MLKIQKNKKHQRKETSGITLIALVITIIVLLILTGISIGMVTGNNGIINKAGEAKLNSEIAKEKEIVEMSTVQAMEKNKYGNLIKSNLQKKVDSNTEKNNSAIVYEDGENFLVVFESGRVYTVDGNGQITDVELNKLERTFYIQLEDSNIGNNEESPYEINCIEDLLDLSIAVNGIRIVDGNVTYVNQYNRFNGKYIRVNRNLNFNLAVSYENAERTDYGDINRDGTIDTLIEELTTGKGWVPIGGDGETKNSAGFAGTFFGKDNGKNIKNLYINDTDTTTPKGLFGVISNSTIKDISVNSNIYCSSGSTGGIIGRTYNSERIEIINCNYSGKIENLSTSSDVGGIIGYFLNASTININNCNNYGEIKGNAGTSDHTRGVGGLVGCGGGDEFEIRNCHNYGTVTGNIKVGGIIGTSPNVSIYNSTNEGPVLGNESVGGIAGFNAKWIEKCYNKAIVTSTGNANGGILGTVTRADVKIFQCYNDKNAVVTGKARTGGILGHIYSSTNTVVEQCYNLAKINGTTTTTGITGCIGGYNAKIINCYNIGNITGTSVAGIARIAAVAYRASTKIVSCYNIGTLNATTKNGIAEAGVLRNVYYLSTCGATDTQSVSKTETELKAIASELDKVFTINDTDNTVILSDDETQGVWLTDASNKNKGYPILNWQNN